MDYTKVWGLLDYVFIGLFMILGILNVVTFVQTENFTTDQLLIFIFNCCICVLMISFCLLAIFKKTKIRCFLYFIGAFLCIIKAGIIYEPDMIMRFITGILILVFTMGGTLTLVVNAVQKLRIELERKSGQSKIIQP